MSDYGELLKDPRWLLKRKVILKRDDFKCIQCGSKIKLQVHHTYYAGGYQPWEYPDDSLITFCEICHKKWHELNKIEFKSHPRGSPKVRKRRRVKERKKKPNKKFKQPPSRKLSLAVIQENRSEVVKLRDGTWVWKKDIAENGGRFFKDKPPPKV